MILDRSSRIRRGADEVLQATYKMIRPYSLLAVTKGGGLKRQREIGRKFIDENKNKPHVLAKEKKEVPRKFSRTPPFHLKSAMFPSNSVSNVNQHSSCTFDHFKK